MATDTEFNSEVGAKQLLTETPLETYLSDPIAANTDFDLI